MNAIHMVCLASFGRLKNKRVGPLEAFMIDADTGTAIVDLRTNSNSGRLKNIEFGPPFACFSLGIKHCSR